jgi:hypothetical protein
MAKLRELKFKYSDGSNLTQMGSPPNQQNQNSPGMNRQSDGNVIGLSVVQENQQMKRDLDFANTEIERLRAKLVFEDCADMPSLSMEMFGPAKSKSPK